MCNCTPNTINIPQAGSNGYNAFTVVNTTLTVSFVADGSTQYTVIVTNNQPTQFTGKWAITGQIIFIQTIGYCTVVSSNSTSITFTIPPGYGNSLPSSLIIGSKISPAGLIGPAGTNAPTSSLSRILFNSDTPISTPGTSGDILHTYTLPLNTLSHDGDTLIIRGEFITDNPSSNDENKYARPYFGTNILLGDFTNIVFNTEEVIGYQYTIYITRNSASQISFKTQVDTMFGIFSLTKAFFLSDSLLTQDIVTGLDLVGTPYNILLKGYNETIGEVTSNYFNIEYIPKV